MPVERVSSELNQEDVFAFVTFLFLSYGRYDDYYGGSRGKVNLGSGEQLKLTKSLLKLIKSLGRMHK